MPSTSEFLHRSPICILGAGPAGLTTSLYLSKFGIEHTVVDKQSFPRDKVCGECFDGRVSRILADLDSTYLDEMRERGIIGETRQYSLHFGGEKMTVAFPAHQRAKLLSKRLDFDRFLYEKAQASPHATFIDQLSIQNVITRTEEVVLTGGTTRIHTPLAILAGGAPPRTDADTAGPSMIYGRRYYRGLPTMTDTEEVELYYFQRPLRGCLVITPLPDGTHNVELGFTRDDYKASGLTLEEILHAYTLREDGLRERFAPATPLDKFKGTYLPLHRRLGTASEARILRAGAALYSFNPLTGAGVGNAMVMGQLAARTARQCVARNDYSHRATQEYERAVRRRLRGMMRFNRGVNLMMRYVHLVEGLLPIFMRMRVVRRTLGQADFVEKVFR